MKWCLLKKHGLVRLIKYLAKNGYDELLMTVAKILSDAGHPAITRAQAWVLLHDLTNKGVPEALRNAEADEKIGFGKLVSSAKKGGVSTVDSVAHTEARLSVVLQRPSPQA